MADRSPPPGWRTCQSQNMYRPWTCERMAEVTHSHETEEGAIDEAWRIHDEAKLREDPVGFGDLRGWWSWNGEQFITDMMDAMIDSETDEKRGFTCQEIREMMEAKFDREYDAEDRHLECKPTQRQVNLGVEHLLMDPTNAYEQDDHIYLTRDELEEKRIEKEIVEMLGGKKE